MALSAIDERTEMQRLREDVDGIGSDVKEIKHALIGSPYTENRGIVNQVQSHETRLTMLEDKVSNGKWLLVGLAFGSGASVAGLITYLVDLFTLHKK